VQSGFSGARTGAWDPEIDHAPVGFEVSEVEILLGQAIGAIVLVEPAEVFVTPHLVGEVAAEDDDAIGDSSSLAFDGSVDGSGDEVLEDVVHFLVEDAQQREHRVADLDLGWIGLWLGFHQAISRLAAMTSSSSTRSLAWSAALSMAVRARLPMARGMPPDWTQ